MGSLYYGGAGDPIEIPERLLAHIKVVITAKLRRNEKFTLSWREPFPGGGRSTIWLDPSIPLRFVFASPDPETLDPAILRTLADEASSSRGLVIDLDPLDFDPLEVERELAGAGRA